MTIAQPTTHADAIFLAGRYSRRHEFTGYARTLQQAGYQICSRWIYGPHTASADPADPLGQLALPFDERRRFAMEDWADLATAAIVVVFLEVPRTHNGRGGRHVELGAALAWGKRVVTVGPLENVYVHLDEVERYMTWEEALEALLHGASPAEAAAQGRPIRRKRASASPPDLPAYIIGGDNP